MKIQLLVLPFFLFGLQTRAGVTQELTQCVNSEKNFAIQDDDSTFKGIKLSEGNKITLEAQGSGANDLKIDCSRINETQGNDKWMAIQKKGEFKAKWTYLAMPGIDLLKARMQDGVNLYNTGEGALRTEVSVRTLTQTVIVSDFQTDKRFVVDCLRPGFEVSVLDPTGKQKKLFKSIGDKKSDSSGEQIGTLGCAPTNYKLDLEKASLEKVSDFPADFQKAHPSGGTTR